MPVRAASPAVLAILLLAAAPAGAANPFCQPEPAVAELLDDMGGGLSLVETSHAEWEAAVARLDEALSERIAAASAVAGGAR